MNPQTHDRSQFDRYLRLLGIERRQPSLEALREIVAAQITRVPFENVSKLYYRNRSEGGRLPGLELHLDGIERFHFGGTCYANNHYFNLLLCDLGYEANLCGCAMNRPDVHVVNIVRLDGGEFVVDGGYAAPFFEPMPRDIDDDFEVVNGRDRYVLRPQDGNGCSAMELHREGVLRHGYTINPTPRPIEHFEEEIARSFTDESTFMNSLLLVRCFPGRSIVLNNLEVIESEGTEWRSYQLSGREEIPGAVEELFGIPADITAEAITALGDLGHAWN